MPFNVRFSLQRWRKSEVTQENKRNRRTQKKGRRCQGSRPYLQTNKTSTKKLFLTTFLLLFLCSLYFLNILLYKLSSREEQNLFAKRRVTSLCRCHKFSLDYLFGWLSASTTSFHRTYSSTFLTFLYLFVSNREELHEFGDIISSEFRSRDHSRFRKRRKSKSPDSYTPFTAVRTNFWLDKILQLWNPFFTKPCKFCYRLQYCLLFNLHDFTGPV